MKRIIAAGIIILFFGWSSKTYAQESKTIAQSLGLFIFPAKDQDKEQQDQDEYQCYKWAKEQTGFDPMNPTKVEAKQAEKGPDGSAVRGAARGAAAGAAIGAITGDAGDGAAVGAIAGAMRGRRARVVGDQVEQQAYNQEAAAKEKQIKDSFNKAFSACMEGKGYTVK